MTTIGTDPSPGRACVLCGLEVFQATPTTRSGAIRRRGDDTPPLAPTLAVVLIVTDGPGIYYVVGLRDEFAISFWDSVKELRPNGPKAGVTEVTVGDFSGETFVVFEAAVKRARDVIASWIMKRSDGSIAYSPFVYEGDARFRTGVTPVYRPEVIPTKPYETTDDEYRRSRASKKPANEF